MEFNEALTQLQQEDLYLIQLPDLTLVVKPLPLIKAQVYKNLAQRNPDPVFSIQLENTIFEECVVESEPDVTGRIPELKAGAIHTTVALILRISLPHSLEDLNQRFDAARVLVDTPEVDLQNLVCRIFGYKPEELQDWSLDKLLRRAAMAEQVLLGKYELGAVEIPIKFKYREVETGKPDLRNLHKENRRLEH